MACLTEFHSVWNGTGLAWGDVMIRWVGLTSVMIAGLIAVLSRVGAAPAPPATAVPVAPVPMTTEAATPAFPPASVRIEHQLIDVQPAAARPPQWRSVARAQNSRPYGRRADPGPFVSRARRVLVGDGRYRPEPFPRPLTR